MPDRFSQIKNANTDMDTPQIHITSQTSAPNKSDHPTEDHSDSSSSTLSHPSNSPSVVHNSPGINTMLANFTSPPIHPQNFSSSAFPMQTPTQTRNLPTPSDNTHSHTSESFTNLLLPETDPDDVFSQSSLTNTPSTQTNNLCILEPSTDT